MTFRPYGLRRADLNAEAAPRAEIRVDPHLLVFLHEVKCRAFQILHAGHAQIATIATRNLADESSTFGARTQGRRVITTATPLFS